MHAAIQEAKKSLATIQEAKKSGIRWGADSIGEYIGRSGREVRHLVAIGALKVSRKGRLMAARESDLDAQFSTESTAAA
jgi:hypothetical protein